MMPVPTPPAAAPKTGRPLRILYADDVKQLRDLFTIVLTREGHVIETVQDGQEAKERLAREPTAIDLLITDHHMPRLQGLELVRWVRTISFRGKIIVFSSELSPGVAAQYQALAVDLLLPKPIFPAALRQALVQLYAPAEPVITTRPPPRTSGLSAPNMVRSRPGLNLGDLG